MDQGPDERPPGGEPDEDVAVAARSTEGRSQRPTSEAFRRFIAGGWAPRPDRMPDPLPAACLAAERRARLSAMFPGERLVVPAGRLRTRSNDTDYRFRPHTAFAYLTGLGAEREPDCVLVLEPRTLGTESMADPGAGSAAAPGVDPAADPGTPPGGPAHEAVLYVRPRADRESREFYADARYGELWVGVRQSLEEAAAETGIRAVHLDRVAEDLAKDVGHVGVRLIRDADPEVTRRVDAARRDVGIEIDPPPATGEEDDDERSARESLGAAAADDRFAAAVSTMRLVKDSWEIDQLRLAVEATATGFDDIVGSLPRAVAHERGERVVEGAFCARARERGNGIGYDVIAAAGHHACTLHWIRNDGPVRDGDLLLVDAGVEIDSLYTADVTRTLPVGGRFTPAQRRVYQAVLDAADAAFAAVRPGASLADVHDAAMQVLAERLADWGLLPVDVATALDREQGGHHRRWVVHGTSHHLGLDVHDCALACREEYVEGELQPGMVFTIEPGLYFRPDDGLIPDELRGIGVRIEDDVVVTADGYENLSAMLPRHPDDVEAWVRDGRR